MAKKKSEVGGSEVSGAGDGLSPLARRRLEGQGEGTGKTIGRPGVQQARVRKLAAKKDK